MTTIPQFYVDWIKRDLGPFWDWLPDGALYHDANAFLKSAPVTQTVQLDVNTPPAKA